LDNIAGVNATVAPMQLPDVGSGTTLLTSLGYFCLLLGIIFLAYYLLKRLGFHGLGIQGGTNAPQLISRLMLGNRQSVAIVRYRDKDMVLGVTEERVSILREFDADYSDEEDGKPKNFATFLKRGKHDEG